MAIDKSQYIHSLMSLEKRNIQLKKIKNFNQLSILKRVKRRIVRFRNRKLNLQKKQTIQFTNTYNQTQEEWLKTLTSKSEGAKVAVYTCIIGGYDDPIEPSFIHPNIDFFLFSDKDIVSSKWEIKEIPKNVRQLENPILINRYLKLHPFEFFADYDYVLYIDGNIEVAADITGLINTLSEYGIAMHQHYGRKCIYKEGEALLLGRKGNAIKIKEQLKRYYAKGMPENFGMAEATMILTDLSSLTAQKIFTLWWDEFFLSESYRDQLAFPYVIWKQKMELKKITTLGRNHRLSGKFVMYKHNNN